MNNSMLGVMLDCSRNAVINVEACKDFIKNIAALGYNTLMLYTEDTYEVENEPYFGHLRGAYTQAELSELTDFGREHSVELIPCIQTLAHVLRIFRWSDYWNIRDCNDILLIGDERVYELIENMIISLKKGCKTDTIHIGMDEAELVGLGKYLHLHGYTDRVQMLLQHLNRVVEICNKHGFTKTMMWSDMFLKLIGGEYYKSEIEIPKEIKDLIPKGLSLVYWDYYSTDTDRYDKMTKTHKLLTDDVIFGGGAWHWVGFVPKNDYSIKASQAALQAMKKNKIKDVFITVWGDNGGETSFFGILPSLIEVSRIYYNKKGDYNNRMCKRLTGLTFDEFMKIGQADMIDDSFPPDTMINNNSKFLLYADILQGLFDAVIPDGLNKVYEKNSEILKSAAKGKYRYIFNTLADLCSVLSVKAELGKKIHANYHKKNLKALEGNIEEIKQTIALTKKFYKSFKTQWMKENKVLGFEVSDIRIGGLIFRMEQAIVTLNDFIKGKTSKIDELEQKRLNPFGTRTDQKSKKLGNACYNSYSDSVTANTL